MAIIAQNQFSIRKLVDGKTLSFTLGSPSARVQIYTPDPPTYAPDYTVGPYLVITPDLYVSGLVGSQLGSLKTTPTWKINGSTVLTDYLATAATTAPYALTIKQNMTAVSQLLIECSAIYVAPVSLAETTISQSINFTKVTNSGASIIAVCKAASGTIFKNGIITSLTAECDMWRGSVVDNTLVSYKWWINSGGTWVDLTVTPGGVLNPTTRQITIPSTSVLNFASFRCDVTDNDPSSSTYNKTVSDVLSFIDMSDPYQLTIDLPMGDGLTDAMTGGITAKINLYQGVSLMPDSFFTGKTCRFFRYTTAGALDTTFGTAGYKTARSITILPTDLLPAALTTFGVDVQ